MEITLQTVREVLRGSFGRDSFVAAFISRVEASPACPTAGIDAHGVMRYNPAFVEPYVTSPADLFCLVTHELMHPLFGHFVFQPGPLENIGADMVINAAISLVFARHSGKGNLFRRFYPDVGIEGLLRPDSAMAQSRYARLYQRFYESHGHTPPLSTGEVIQTLKVLTPARELPVVTLLGSHHGNGATSHQSRGLDADQMARIANDLARIAESPGGAMAGYGEPVYAFLIQVLKTHQGLKRALLDRFVTRRKLDRFKRLISHTRIGVSPIPIQPSKRDYVLLAAGVPPFHYHNRASRVTTQDQGLAVYLDVSGSVNQHLPRIIGLLQRLKAELTSVFLFSNAVVEVPFKTLRAGRIETTYGTDFDCIAEHILAHHFDKAVILTDGFAGMTEDNREQLRARSFRALTVLFGGRSDSPEFEVFGDVVLLQDVTA